jgi:FkbM family methyltransferase
MNAITHEPQSPLSRAYRFINRPYYWYRPAQIARRLRVRRTHDGLPRLERMAWGSRLYCWPDPLGRAIARTGVYDLIVAETLARLADPGELAVDAGANVGVMSNLLAHAVGAEGRVISFEPHPTIFATLSRSVGQWQTAEGIRVVELRQAAVSAAAGVLPLAIDPDTFAGNKGTASLEHVDPDNATDVQTVRLDDELAGPVGVLKLDVEMHELAALQGAASMLSAGLIRDIVFEEHDPPPTAVTRLLESHGYTVFSVRQGLAGPVLSAAADAYRMKLWDPPALLATREPERARERLRPRGWISLRGHFR